MDFEESGKSERITQIHPINANYLLDTEPHRLYGDRGGNLLEIIVQRFASTVAEKLYGHGGIVAFGYEDATTDGERSFHNAFILRRDGKIRTFHILYGELPAEIDLDIFYMALNPVEINNWFIQDPREVEKDRQQVEKERQSFARFGLGIKLAPRNTGITGVKESLVYMRERYLRTLK